MRGVFARTNLADEISTKVFSLSAGTGAWHAPVFAGRGKVVITFHARGFRFGQPFWGGLVLLDGVPNEVAFCHPIFQGLPCFTVAPKTIRVERFVPSLPKGSVFWRTLSKRSQNARPQNEILCSNRGLGALPSTSRRQEM